MTSWLLAHDPPSFHRATHPPFLRAAGQGKVPKLLLSQYLSQDRLYGHAYIRFIGQLLGKIRLDSPDHNNLTRRISDMLIDALVNIRRELAFFDDVVERYKLQLEGRNSHGSEIHSLLRPSPITRAYIDFFASVSNPGASLLEGLVALWGTEKCYHEAWLYAKSFIPNPSTTETYRGDPDAGALRNDLVPNWTSAEFGQFVQAIGGL
ncbi:MAG: hypothetical protein Q9187_007761, partial [Circinaria calcarea]